MIRLLKIVFVLMFLASCSNNEGNEHDKMKEQEHNGHENHDGSKGVKKYTCPMHPEIIRDEPGQCPICKMDLVEMNSDEVKSKNTELDVLLKPTNKYVISQVKTISMQQKKLPLSIEATGKINYDTREISTVSSKVSGRIEKLYIKYLYQPVSKGQKLMDVYSKELVTEQENYLYLLKNDADNSVLIKTAEDRLMLQGLTAEQLKKIRNDKKAIEYVSIYSPFSGHLHDLIGEKTSAGLTSMNEPKQGELLIREGMYVQKGQGVFNVYGTDKLWALLSIYADNQNEISKGQKVSLSIDGKELSGNNKIDFIEPEIKGNQNTMTARVYISNPNNSIKVGSNVKAVIDAGDKTGLFIPITSVVNLGNNRVVFLKQNNLFKAHKIATGVNTGNLIEVVSGIDEKDVIAENAQLLMDSESFIKSEN